MTGPRPRAMPADNGGQVVGMRLEPGRGNGLINHTLRHWLALGFREVGELDAVKPTGTLRAQAWSAAACRQWLVEEGILTQRDLAAIPYSSATIEFEPRWWTGPMKVAITRVHDKGYFIAYLSLVRRVGLPDNPTATGWRVPSPGKVARRELDTEDGYEVDGDWDGGSRTLFVVSARSSTTRIEPERRNNVDPGLQAKRDEAELRRELGLR